MKSAMKQLLKLLFLLLITHYGVRFILDPVVDHLCARFIPAAYAASLDNTRHANYISHMPFITGGFVSTTSATAAAATSDTLATAQLKSNERRHQISDDDDGDCAAYCRKGCEGSTNGICYDWCVYFCARRPPV